MVEEERFLWGVKLLVRFVSPVMTASNNASGQDS